MKVLFLTEGGRDIGLGHLMRCQALADEFRRASKRIEVYFTVLSDRLGERFIKQGKGSLISFNWIKDINRTLELANAADLVIIDSYLAPASLYSKIYSLNDRPYIAVIDDYNRIKYKADMVINPSVCRKSDLSYNNGSIKYLLGACYVILRRDFRVLTKKPINKTVRKILITFGGGSNRHLTAKILRFLSGKGYILDVVSSGSKLLLGNKNVKFHAHLSALDMRRLMMNCDLCISAGGQTLNELAFLGVPTIAVCCAQNQQLNLRCFERLGFISNIGWYTDSNLLNKLELALKDGLVYSERLKRSHKGMQAIDGKGSLRIVNSLIKSLSKVHKI